MSNSSLLSPSLSEVINDLQERSPLEIKDIVLGLIREASTMKKHAIVALGFWAKRLLENNPPRDALYYISGHVSAVTNWSKDTVGRYVLLGQAVVDGRFPRDVFEKVSIRAALSIERLQRNAPEKAEEIFEAIRNGEIYPESAMEYVAAISRSLRGASGISFKYDPIEGSIIAVDNETGKFAVIAIVNLGNDSFVELARDALIKRVTKGEREG